MGIYCLASASHSLCFDFRCHIGIVAIGQLWLNLSIFNCTYYVPYEKKSTNNYVSVATRLQWPFQKCIEPVQC